MQGNDDQNGKSGTVKTDRETARDSDSDRQTNTVKQNYRQKIGRAHV